MHDGVRFAGRLSQQTLGNLLQFLLVSAALRDLASFCRHIVCDLRTVLHADLTAYHEITPVKFRTIWMATSADTAPLESPHVLEVYPNRQPYTAHYSGLDEDPVLDFHDYLTWMQFRRLRVFSDFYRQMGVRYQVMLGLPSRLPPSEFAGIMLGRRHEPFSRRDHYLLRILRPQVIQGYRNAQAFSSLRQEQARAVHIAETFGIEVIVVDREGRIHSASPHVRQWVENFFADGSGEGDLLRQDRLPATLAHWVRAQQTFWTGERLGLQLEPERREPLVVSRNGKCLVARLIDEGDELLLVLHEEQHRSRDDDHQAAWREKFSLTPREAEVLTWVMYGKTNIDIGTILGISSRTVAKHLEHIYPRLGVETRTSAVTRILSSDSAVEAAPEQVSALKAFR